MKDCAIIQPASVFTAFFHAAFCCFMSNLQPNGPAARHRRDGPEEDAERREGSSIKSKKCDLATLSTAAWDRAELRCLMMNEEENSPQLCLRNRRSDSSVPSPGKKQFPPQLRRYPDTSVCKRISDLAGVISSPGCPLTRCQVPLLRVPSPRHQSGP